MEVGSIITTAITMITALGGLEFLKWLWTRKSKARLAAAEANAAELKAEKDEYYLLTAYYLEGKDKARDKIKKKYRRRINTL